MTKVNSSTGSNVQSMWVAVGVALALTCFRTMTDNSLQAASLDNTAAKSTVEERIKPSGEVSIATVARPLATVPEAAPASDSGAAAGSKSSAASAPAAAGNKLGETTYNSLCMGCHASGALGSPKFGDKAAWAPRIAQGMEALYNSALKGKKSMPAKGGNPGLSDADVKATVDYMVAAVK